MSRQVVRISTFALSLVAVALARADVIYADAAATGAGTGQTWSDAYTDLQQALAAAGSGDQIWIATGTYAPAGPDGSRAATFQLASGVALYGGFAGGETDLSQRDWSAHPTVLSGDLNGNDQPDWSGTSENSYHVVTGAGVDATCVLDGLTITGGNAWDAAGPNSFGSGMVLDNSSPTISHCTFAKNITHLGAGITNIASSPTLTDCLFQGNWAYIGRGGAIYNASGSNPVITGCRFVANASFGASSVGDGGAMFNEFDCVITLTDCVFRDNTSTAYEPAFSNGGAICNLGDSMIVRNCRFYHNSALVAGGVWTGRPAIFVNCVFTGNSSLAGGGMYVFLGAADLINCTFSRNSAEDGAGVANAGTLTVRNCIFWGNTSQGSTDARAQIHNVNGGSSIQYTCLQSIFDPIPGEDPPDPADFPGCTGANPLLIDSDGADNVVGTEDDDLRIGVGSPCIDAADNLSVPGGIGADLDGYPRFSDDCLTADTGQGTAPIVDMGAHEYQGPPFIVRDPVSVTVPLGEPASFTVTAVGAPPLTYQWRKDGVDVPGATGPTLDVASAQAADAGGYDVLVTGPCGSVASLPATLTVAVPAEVRGTVSLGSFVGDMTAQPVTFELRSGQNPVETHTVNLAADGSFVFTTDLRGVYDVTARAAHWLRGIVLGVNITDVGAQGLSYSLLNGDADGNNAVELADLNAVLTRFGTPDAMTDLDGNGSTGLSDINVTLINFGLTGVP